MEQVIKIATKVPLPVMLLPCIIANPTKGLSAKGLRSLWMMQEQGHMEEAIGCTLTLPT